MSLRCRRAIIAPRHVGLPAGATGWYGNRHASSCSVSHREAYSDHQHAYKMCLCVTLRGCRRSHNALFLTWANAASPHEKAHSAPPPHGKAHSATRFMNEASTPRSQAIKAAFHTIGSGDPLPSLYLCLLRRTVSLSCASLASTLSESCLPLAGTVQYYRSR